MKPAFAPRGRWLWGTVSVFLLCGCAAGRPKDDLETALNMFHHDLRWQYFKTAAARISPPYAAAFLEEMEKGEHELNIADYEIRRVDISPDGTSARVRVRLSYYRMPSTVLKDETLEQTWKKTEAGWMLIAQEGGPFVIPPLEKKETPSSAEPSP